MPKRGAGSEKAAGNPAPQSANAGQRELVVIADAQAGLRVQGQGVASIAGADASGLAAIAARPGITLRTLFGLSEDRLLARSLAAPEAAAAATPDLSVFYHVDAPEEQLDELAEELLAEDTVVAAYVKPPGEEPVLNDMAPSPEDAPPSTPDFVARQIYLNAAPAGVDAAYAWTFPGGRGAGVRIIDCEWGWRFSHEDLGTNQGGIVFGTGSTDTNHGTAVIGEISGDRNTFGITGICPDAVISGSAFSGPSAASIRAAADKLAAGDIILLEIHRAGPRFNFAGRQDQAGYIAIEWWPDDWAAIRYATSKGILVVEAAGNGQENLDDAIYSVRPSGFPASWTNPFNRANPDCGAIVVGAGAPPPGTHGRDHGADRSRLDFSNYGALIDCQGWGREVTSTGYGDLQGGANADLWYTDTFSGTSSASPIVTGVLGCVQGGLRGRGRPVLTPAQARAALRATGSPQQDTPGRPATQRIGNRPDLHQLFTSYVKGGVLVDKVTKEKNEAKDLVKEKELAKDRKDLIKEVKEHKEVKEVKEVVKDVKEKELKEIAKERKELVENKRIDFEDRVIGGRVVDVGRMGGVPAADDTIEARLSRIEDAVTALTHFIGSELRPDLVGGALVQEQDLQQQAANAKWTKDMKDKEHLSEG